VQVYVSPNERPWRILLGPTTECVRFVAVKIRLIDFVTNRSIGIRMLA
jgi:hypothetical protein